MDEIASISAHKHCGRVVVTASINNVSFNEPIFAGEIISLNAKVSRAFNSSMEVFIDVFVRIVMVLEENVMKQFIIL